jgi:RES domain-containing protein
VAYAAGNAGVATLELLVNVPASVRLPEYSIVTCHFPEVLVEEIVEANLPANWRDYPPPAALQAVGDEWVNSRASAVLKVPSAVVPFDTIYLLNPEHPDFRSIDVGEPRPFKLDFRLLT